MKSIAFALVLVATVVAAEDAPEEGVLVPIDCRSDGDCQKFDQLAKCLEGVCDCSGDDRSRYCTLVALVDHAADIIKLTLGFVFRLLRCIDVITPILRDAVKKKVTQNIVEYHVVCGSVIVVLDMEVELGKVDQVMQATTEEMLAVQEEVPELQGAEMTTDFVFGNDTIQCEVDNAVSSIFLEDKICFPTCETGYARVEDNGTYSCNMETPMPATASGGDDDLSGPAVAAVVIAVVMLLGIIAAIVYFVAKKPNDDVPTHENEPYNEEKPTEGNQLQV